VREYSPPLSAMRSRLVLRLVRGSMVRVGWRRGHRVSDVVNGSVWRRFGWILLYRLKERE
jgi:hypothetical protein